MAGVVNTGGDELPAGGGGDPAAVRGSGREEEEVRAALAREGEAAAVRSASEEVAGQFRTLVNAAEVGEVKQLQHLILGRLQDSNAVLSHFNDYSERCYADVSGEFPRNARLLKSMKSDLDHIFIKLRSMKSKLKAVYPDAFPDGSTAEIQDQRPDLERPLEM